MLDPGSDFSIMLVDDEPQIHSSIIRCLRKEPYVIETCHHGKEALEIIERKKYDLYILDLLMPGMDGLTLMENILKIHGESDVLILSGTTSIQEAVNAVKRGARDFIEKPFHPESLRRRLDEIYQIWLLNRENERLRSDAGLDFEYKNFIGNSRSMLSLKEMICRVAPTEEPVIIYGETGTGKELIARALHHHSRVRDQVFLPVDCTGLSDSLFESELFGHSKGAFTGAEAAKPGLIRAAEGGTLFLDEIGELPLNVQSKLLRVLQEKTIRPVGGAENIPVNIRIIAATNRNLEEEVDKGLFRKDLYYRLNVIALSIPSLKNRKDDIPLLVRFFLQEFKNDVSPVEEISADALQLLENYHWPGNVRELENCIRRAVALGGNKAIALSDLPAIITGAFSPAGPGATGDFSLLSAEKKAIERALEHTGGNRNEAAEILGIGIATLYRKVKLYGISS